jgi:hypothetical protein
VRAGEGDKGPALILGAYLLIWIYINDEMLFIEVFYSKVSAKCENHVSFLCVIVKGSHVQCTLDSTIVRQAARSRVLALDNTTILCFSHCQIN